MSVYDDIKSAKDIISGIKHNKKNPIFHSNSAVYKFTNENVGGYYDLLKLNNKNMLTVCSSGDHILEAILRDANKVDCFDISIFTKYFMNLKLSAVLTLEYYDFVKYFFHSSNFFDIFSETTYSKIRKNLEKIDFNSSLFWDVIYTNFDGYKIYSSKLFEHNTFDIDIFANKKSSYLNKDNYYILKNKLEKYISINNKILFYQSNITDLHNILKDKYDIIILSNISNYMNNIYKENAYYNFYNLVINELDSCLNENGIIQAAYLYFERTMEYFVLHCLQNRQFDILSFNSVSIYEPEKMSHILTYKK